MSTAAYTLGIPHPPGYPLYTLIASLFARLPSLEPAAGVALLSALCAAFAILVLIRTSAALATSNKWDLAIAIIPPLVGLSLAFSTPLWSQATLAQVYNLNLLLVSLILWSAAAQNPIRGPVAALSFGLGLVHHLSILFLLPINLTFIRPSQISIRRWVLALSPLALYAYLPLRAFQFPPLNWGNPVTPERFLWLVSAAPYGGVQAETWNAEMVARAGLLLKNILETFTPLALPFAVLGLALLARRRTGLAMATALSFVFYSAYAIALARRDIAMYTLPVLAIFSLWLAYGLVDLASRLPRSLGWVLVILLAALPIGELVLNFNSMDLSRDRTAFDYAKGIIDEAPRDSIIFAEGDDHVMALTYYRNVIVPDRSSVVVVSQGLLQYDWYYDNLRAAMNEVSLAGPDVRTDSHQRAVEIANVAFAEGRGVCFTKTAPLLPEFDYDTNVDIKCVVAQRN